MVLSLLKRKQTALVLQDILAIASALGIPVFNLAKPDAEQRLDFLVESTRTVSNS